ncbi:GFA family protein [Roseovarius sp. EL26]|uniref:GFA family protein n=1 Tax=Roseovarius sp. EL26 TaxID=2126672 RepID=UPI000EA10205|nr:GFA family protein [Roseovarius sp. EL26]
MKCTGSCECGAVTYVIEAEMPDVTICHCGQCLRTSGHAWASVSVPVDTVEIAGTENLKWFTSSDIARRGFCTECGSSLFFERIGKNRIAIGAGTLTQPTELKTGKHIFIADKGDYYDISCDAPQYDFYE